MNIIKVADLQVGMEFDASVFVEDDVILVPAGVAIREKDLQRLVQWGVEEVTTEGSVIDHTPADVKADFEFFGLSADSDSVHFYKNAVSFLTDIFNRISKKESFNTTAIDTMADLIIKYVREQRNETISLIICSSAGDGYAKSSLNCAILSAVIGVFSHMEDKTLQNLVIGAILHDCGMLRIPEEIRNKNGKLSEPELKTLRMHTLYSYQIMAKELYYSEDVAQIALQHHERWNGAGYPQGIKETEISNEARIVSVADAFEAMVCERPYRNSMTGYFAMKNILSDNSRRFDPAVVKSFISSMGIYPIGSIVLLSNSSIGRVISVHSNTPLRPELMLLIDSDGTEYKDGSGLIVDLLQEKNLFILKALDVKSLATKKG
ncbi:MAG: HD-GYP domain-containing protein [Spirochaetaceae bacterium]|nr:HD-GYP domain-containing protein [Spirochaetaceae bacterium]